MKISARRKDLKAKSPDELTAELHALLREQFGLRMQKATQQLTNHAKLPAVRRDIARVRTRLSQTKTKRAARRPRPGRTRAASFRPRSDASSATRWTRPSRSWSSAA